MTTTVAVRESTRQRLDRLKRKRRARSYDAVISELLDAADPSPSSMFGVDRDKPPLTKKERLAMWDEED